MILVSYILPCYNTEPFIDQCINSLYDQDFAESEFEVICVNNASQDNVDARIINAKTRHNNIVHIKLSTNVFSGGAYNEGIKVAKGKYLVFVDSDDFLCPNSIRPIIHDMECNALEALQINIQPFDFAENLNYDDLNNLSGNGNFYEQYDLISGLEYMTHFKSLYEISLMPIPAYRRIYLRDFIVNNKLFFTLSTMGCDLLHTLQVLSVLNRLKIITSNIYMFRYNPNGVTKGNWSKEKNYSMIVNMLKSYDIILALELDTQIKQLYLSYIKRMLNLGLTYIHKLSLSDKKNILSVLDLSDVKKKVGKFRIIDTFPNFYLLLYTYLGSNISLFFIRSIDYIVNKIKIQEA